jgi:hypothetical protein
MRIDDPVARPLEISSRSESDKAKRERLRFGGRIPPVIDNMRDIEEWFLSKSPSIPHLGFLFFTVTNLLSVFHYQHSFLIYKNKVLRRSVGPATHSGQFLSVLMTYKL